MRHHLFNIGLSAMVLVSISPSAFAAKTYHKERTAAEKDYKQASDETSKVRQRLNTAEQDITTATRAMEQAIDKLRPEFESSPDWVAANTALQSAKVERDAAVNPVLEKLRERDDYKAALAAKDAAAAEVTRLRSASAKQDELTAAAQKSVQASQAVAKLELDAVKADAPAQAAIAKLADAGKHCAELRNRFNDSIKDRPEIAAARKSLSDARDKRDKVKTELREAQRKEADAQAELSDAEDRERKAQQSKQGHGGNSGQIRIRVR